MSDSTTNSSEITGCVYYPWKPFAPRYAVNYSAVLATMNKMTLVRQFITETVTRLNINSLFIADHNEIGRVEFKLCDVNGTVLDDNLTMENQFIVKLVPSKIAVRFLIHYGDRNFLAKIPFGSTLRQVLEQQQIYVIEPIIALIDNDREITLDTPLTLEHHAATISFKKAESSIKFSTPQKISDSQFSNVDK